MAGEKNYRIILRKIACQKNVSVNGVIIMLGENNFKRVAAVKDNPNWLNLTTRENALYGREDEIRSPFARGYTRITAYYIFSRVRWFY